MQTKSKNIIVNSVTFVINTLVSLAFLAFGYLEKNFGTPDLKEVVIGNITIILAITLLTSSIFMLIKNNFQTYIVSNLIALGLMIYWILAEKSIDVELFLPVYLSISTLLSLYKYKLNKSMVKI